MKVVVGDCEAQLMPTRLSFGVRRWSLDQRSRAPIRVMRGARLM